MRQKIFLLLFLFITQHPLLGQSIDSLSYGEINGQINHYEAITPFDSVSICISEFTIFSTMPKEKKTSQNVAIIFIPFLKK